MSDKTHYRAIVIGTGFAGLGMAIRLRQQGMTDFVVLERAADVGGTWRDNSYPACACDVLSHLYSFSFALNPSWSRSFSGQREIWNYLRHCTDNYGLRPHIRFPHEVLNAVWAPWVPLAGSHQPRRTDLTRTDHGDWCAVESVHSGRTRAGLRVNPRLLTLLEVIARKHLRRQVADPGRRRRWPTTRSSSAGWTARCRPRAAAQAGISTKRVAQPVAA